MTLAIDANAVVCMSDIAISHETKTKLKAAVTPLENVPASKMDWHPGSGDRVLDLVHPSICPLVYGRTRILPQGTVPLADCHRYAGKGEVISKPTDVPHHYSNNFQWLPCEVRLQDDGHAKITSYINNLHPDGNEPLYSAIEEVISQTVPLWVGSLASTLVLPNVDRMEDVGDGYVLGEDEQSDNDDSDSEDDFVLPEPIKYGIRVRVSSILVPDISIIKG